MFSIHLGTVLCFAIAAVQAAVIPPPSTLSSPDMVCANQSADVFFLLDSSSSVWIVDYWKMLDFVASLVDQLPVESGRMRVGAAVFSTSYHPGLSLSRPWTNKSDLQQSIRNLDYVSGNTYTDVALEGMRGQGLSDARPNTPKIAILFTDGCSQHAAQTEAAALRARQEGVEILTVGIGGQVCPSELLSIAGHAKSVFQTPSFNSLPDLRRAIMDRLCQVAATSGKPTVQPKCNMPEKTDVMFVYDSACIGTHKVKTVNSFISKVVQEFDIASGKVRSGVLSQNVLDTDVQLNKFQDADGIAQDLTSKHFPELSLLVKKLRLQSFTSPEGGRQDAEKRAVIIVDSQLAEPQKVQLEVDRAQLLWNIKVYLVVIGNADVQLRLPEGRRVTLASVEGDAGALDATRDKFLTFFCKA